MLLTFLLLSSLLVIRLRIQCMGRENKHINMHTRKTYIKTHPPPLSLPRRHTCISVSGLLWLSAAGSRVILWFQVLKNDSVENSSVTFFHYSVGTVYFMMLGFLWVSCKATLRCRIQRRQFNTSDSGTKSLYIGIFPHCLPSIEPETSRLSRSTLNSDT